MTIYDATLEALESDSTIQAAWRDASPGDRSLLLTMLERGVGELLTVVGSANHALWSRFIAQGWMEQSLSGGPNESSPVETFRVKLTELGWRAIPIVLARLRIIE